MGNQHVIETQNLSKLFGSFEAVHALNLQVAQQQITGFLGRNGAGKTTTIKMLLGMTHPTSGTGQVLGKRIDIQQESIEMRRQVAYVGEDKQLYPYLTVAEMIRFTRSFYEDWRPEVEQRLLEQYELPADRQVKFLSKGMRTKLALLLALARRPSLLILDEPSEGLDPVSVEELLQTLVAAASEGTAIFFSSHQIEEVERIADRICLIDHGNLLMDFALDKFRLDYRRITLGFASQPPPPNSDFFRLTGIDHIRTAGRQITLLASHDSDGLVERARELHAVSVEVEPVTLREVFLEKVKEEA
jgi:ABC-2 type transport system ATP-binding protein